MEHYILDAEKLIQLNRLPEVKEPGMFKVTSSAAQLSIPKEEGIFSNEIFSLPGTTARIDQYAWIDLGCTVFHPHIWNKITELDQRIVRIATGEIKALLDNDGNITLSDTGNWGLPWLLDVMPKINFTRPNMVKSRVDKINLVKTALASEPGIRFRKKIIIPAGFREPSTDANGNMEVGEINENYVGMLHAALMLKTLRPDEDGYKRQCYRMQMMIQEDYRLVYRDRNWGGGKKSYWKQNVCGRQVDLSALGVLSLPKFTTKPDAPMGKGLEVGYGQIGVPLHQLCALFYPFVTREINTLMTNSLQRNDFLVIGDGTSETGLIKCKNLGRSLSDQGLEETIERYAMNPDTRWETLKVEDGKTGKITDLMLGFKYLNRPFTVTDMLFIACSRAIEGKYIDAVRYPVESVHSHAYQEPVIITTEKTMKMTFGPGYYGSEPLSFDNYPVFGSSFRDAILEDVTIWDVKGADTDGDTELMNGIWASDINLAIAAVNNSKKTVLSPSGKSIRDFSKGGLIGLFWLTSPTARGVAFSKTVSELSAEDTARIIKTCDDGAVTLRWLLENFTGKDFRKNPKMTFQHPMTVGGKKILAGQYILYRALTGISERAAVAFDPVWGMEINKKGFGALTEMMETALMNDVINMSDVRDFYNVLVSYGFGLVGTAPGYSTSLMKLPPLAAKMKAEILEKYRETVFDPVDTIRILEFEKQILAQAEDELRDSPEYQVYFASGSSGSWNDTFKTMALWVGVTQNLATGKDMFVEFPLSDEMDVAAYAAKADAAVVGAIGRALKTANGGYREKILNTIAQNIHISKEPTSDCGTRIGFPIEPNLIGYQDFMKFFKQMYAFDPDTKKEFLVSPAESERLQGFWKGEGRTFMVRLPTYCKSEPICAHCVGRYPYLTDFGEGAALTLARIFSYLKLKDMKSFHNQAKKVSRHDPAKVFQEDGRYQSPAEFIAELMADPDPGD